MEDIAWNMGAGQKGHWNNQTKTSHNQFKFFTGNHSHSESFWQRLQCFTVLYIKIYTLCFRLCMFYTAWKVSKYGVISAPYFPVFGLNTGKYGPEITPYLDTFHVVLDFPLSLLFVIRIHIVYNTLECLIQVEKWMCEYEKWKAFFAGNWCTCLHKFRNAICTVISVFFTWLEIMMWVLCTNLLISYKYKWVATK